MQRAALSATSAAMAAASSAATASAGPSNALAPPQGSEVLKLCTFNAACKEDDQLTKQWTAYTAHLRSQWDRIMDMGANMVCLQECAMKVLNFLGTISGWHGHWHEEQKFALMWNPQVPSTTW